MLLRDGWLIIGHNITDLFLNGCNSSAVQLSRRSDASSESFAGPQGGDDYYHS